jgi:hypothetical protein
VDCSFTTGLEILLVSAVSFPDFMRRPKTAGLLRTGNVVFSGAYFGGAARPPWGIRCKICGLADDPSRATSTADLLIERESWTIIA